MKNDVKKNIITIAAWMVSHILATILYRRLVGDNASYWEFLSLTVLAAATIGVFTDNHIMARGTAAGYVIGVIAGILFHQEGTDPGGGRTDNLWLIWILVYLAAIVLSILIQVIVKKRKRSATVSG